MFNDPLGLTVWVCSRAAKRPMTWVDANHSYLFDDRKGESCGLTGSPHPFNPFPDYGSTHQEKGPNDGASCRRIDGSEDPLKADSMMKCCKSYISSSYIPGYNDCHNLTHSCITSAGLKDPGAPGARFGPRCITCQVATPPASPKRIDWTYK